MGRALKRHVQGELFPKHGGKRKGAGRPPKNKLRPSQPHKKRPAVKQSVPLHVTARVVDELAELRQRDAYKAIRRAMTHVYARDEFHIVHVSIERSHIHFIIEASDRMALARGMKALEISAARHINRAFSKHRSQRRRGQVFCDRYDSEPITNRRQARNTLAYVLNNWRKHGEHRVPELRGFQIDPFSSALGFDGWREPIDARWPPTYEPLPVWKPRSWLLTTGWRMYGLIGTHEVPGPRSKRARRTTAMRAPRSSVNTARRTRLPRHTFAGTGSRR